MENLNIILGGLFVIALLALAAFGATHVCGETQENQDGGII
jgi:hypothetical protein